MKPVSILCSPMSIIELMVMVCCTLESPLCLAQEDFPWKTSVIESKTDTETNEELSKRISASINEKFPNGAKVPDLEKYAKRLHGECEISTVPFNVNVGPHRFSNDRSFAENRPQHQVIACGIPEKTGLFLRTSIVIKANIENDEIKSVMAYRVTAHFP